MPIMLPNGETLSAEDTGRSSSVVATPLEGPVDPNEYVCGAGDRFELAFWGKQNFRLQVTADLEGRVFLSKIGFVAVAGKTLTAARGLVKKKVQSDYPGLGFDLILTQPRNFLVHVAEDVKTPGTYTATALDRVSSVVSRAGGPTGSRRGITLTRKDGTQLTADLLMYDRTGDTKYNPRLLDGDVIRIPPRQSFVKISGAVNYPGQYELVGTKDLSELLALAGGFTTDVASDLPIRVARRNEKQQEAFIDLPFVNGVPKNMSLNADDEVIVQGLNAHQRYVLLIGAVADADPLDPATKSVRLPFIDGDTVRSLIEKAGGVTVPGDLTHAYILRKGAKPETIPLDLDALLVRRDFSADKPVQMGDVIVVPAMRHSILVEGAVVRGGLYPYNPNFGISQYLMSAGGRTRNAEGLDEVRLVRPDGKTFSFDSAARVAPGDTIMVPERKYSRGEVIQLVMAGAGLLLSGVAITLAATR